MNYKSKFLLIFNILSWSWILYQFNTEIMPYFERVKYNKVEVVSNIVLPDPIDLGIQFEYCVLPSENIDLVAQSDAGTPVPYEPVPISTEVIAEQPTAEVQSTPIPLSTPIPTATSTPAISEDLNLKVVRAEGFLENNFHLVLVGVGYDENNGREMQKIIDSLNEDFVGINVDFAYVDSSLDLDFKHIQQQVVFSNVLDQKALFKAIKRVYPVDGLVMAICTPLFLGTSHGNAAMLTANDPSSLRIAVHEIGHQLGLDDGYQAFYEGDRVPSTELFYLDKIPERLVTALNKLDKMPPMYKVGTCDGKSVYSFYESGNNVMRDYAPTTANSWGASTFTPLQIVLMNDYIAWYKDLNK